MSNLNIMNSSVKRVMKNLKDNETINAFGEVVEKGAGDCGNHLDLFKESLKDIQNEMDEFFEEMDAKIAELKKGNN